MTVDLARRRVRLASGEELAYAHAVAEHVETEYPQPISVYGASKLAVEALMHAFAAQYGVDGVALRFTHVYGPGRTTECFVGEMLTAAAEGRACHIP